MKLKKLLVLGVAAATFAGTTLGVSAAGLKDVFDAEYYASQYPDLKESCGNDKEKLYEHFITFGLKEGRKASPIIDVAAYKAAYPDLSKAFGDDWDKYVEHYFTFGLKEGRKEGVMFNPAEYAAAYSDIAKVYGDDYVGLAQHYITFGQDEGREAGTSQGYESLAALEKAEEEAARDEGTYTRKVVNSKGYYYIYEIRNSDNKTEKYDYYRSDGSLYIHRDYQYDDSGNRTQSTSYNYDTKGNMSYYTVYEYAQNEENKTVTTSSTTYDAEGNVISRH